MDIEILQFKKTIRKALHSIGLELHRLTPTSNPSVQLLTCLNHVQADVVFDVGANVGQFAQELRSLGFSGEIISFEPLSIAHAVLSKAAQADAKWKIHPRGAVGDQDGEIEINIASNSVSSSVLPMLHAHSSAAVGSAYVASECTPLTRLDSVAHTYLSANARPFIKIDTQGFESQVLDGAAETLKRAHGVQLELSLVPLYEGQTLWLEMIQRMADQGFTLWAIQNGFIDPRTGRSLQVDGIFLRQ
jgi:FkbM family methyltransferase